MSRYDGEDMAWDGGPPGAESDPVPQPWGSAAPPSKGIVQMAYSSYLPQTGPPNAPFGFTRDDFLYTTSANVPGKPTQLLDKKEIGSFPRSRQSPPPLHGRHDRNKSYIKHSKSRSRSPKRRFKESRSRSLSKERSSRSYNKPQSFNENKSYNSRKQRKCSSSSSDSSDGSKSPSQPLPKERLYKHKEDIPARSDSKIKDFENEKIKSKKHLRHSRSPSPESSSSKSSSFSERHYNNHPKGGRSLANASKFQARRQKNSSPEPSGSDGYYKGQMKPNRPQNFRLDYKNSRTGNFSRPSDHRPQTTEEHLNYPPVSHIYPPPAAAPFRNDGSFLEMFKKLQESQKAELETASTTIPELEKPELKKPALPMVGKRRGGRVLKTGMVKKPKSIEEQTVDNPDTPTDAWSLYLKEVKKYKDSSCDEECKMRPLFK